MEYVWSSEIIFLVFSVLITLRHILILFSNGPFFPKLPYVKSLCFCSFHVYFVHASVLFENIKSIGSLCVGLFIYSFIFCAPVIIIRVHGVKYWRPPRFVTEQGMETPVTFGYSSYLGIVLDYRDQTKIEDRYHHYRLR